MEGYLHKRDLRKQMVGNNDCQIEVKTTWGKCDNNIEQ